jgi:plastocyanin
MRIKSLILPTAVATVVAVIALGLGHSRGGSAPTTSDALSSAKTAHLTIANYAFDPTPLTVRAGATITVTNTDRTAHTATASSGAFDSGTLKPGQPGHFTLKTPGTYPYICQFHAFMTGTIKVVR